MKDVLELIGIIIVAVFIVTYLMWRVDRGKNTPRISFKLFKEMYQLNPEKWSMYENYLYVNYDDNNKKEIDKYQKENIKEMEIHFEKEGELR